MNFSPLSGPVSTALANRDRADTVRERLLKSMALPEQSKPSMPLNADQALGMVSFGLMQRLAQDGQGDLPWLESNNTDAAERIRLMRQRLELTALALDTGAPLSTAEVSFLMGARPGKDRVERGGLVARRVNRNVWRLSRLEMSDNNFRQDGFRRRL